ncbi:hypothetical protein [Henriciella litoralis]|uniref:hypothetical protein n=1 Tax=Henriciella litoralis TaxID=568102 RepID=UPI0009FFAB03|nr:hypothetical protein [Henriciella litoralis]
MRYGYFIAVGLLVAPIAGAQEPVDQAVRTAPYVYSGAKASERTPPPPPEVMDQFIRADAFVYTGARARADAAPPLPEITDQAIAARAFVFTGAKAGEH